MTDMNKLCQLIADVSSDGFFFSIDFDGRTKIIWVFLHVANKVVESSSFEMLDAEKAIEWVENSSIKNMGECKLNPCLNDWRTK